MLDFSKQVEFFELCKLVNYTIIYIYFSYTLVTWNLHALFSSFEDFIFHVTVVICRNFSIQKCSCKIVIDSWKFTMLLLYILWDDRPIFMISDSNKQLQQELESLIITAGDFPKSYNLTLYIPMSLAWLNGRPYHESCIQWV